ncbi:MAG: LacI family transcriptional regulator [Deltaproteobacteria bacterium]|nr:MAG: LacI family transcriptional regulator [Deltaproteobacteria bacterium]
MGKPTTKDLARVAGVSLATVDRVLNRRGGVRQATVDRVTAAIKSIGYVRDISAANLARSTEYRLVFLLPDHEDEFTRMIHLAIDEANVSMVHERTTVSIMRVPANDPHRIAQEIDELSTDQVDGVAIMAPETAQVRDAILRLDACGIAVVAFVSNQPNAANAYFVGINNEAAGRTAGQLLARFTGERQGAVRVITETMQSRDSQERRLGFDAIMAKYASRLRVYPSMETYADAARTAKIVAAAWRNTPEIVGVYLMHHGISETMRAIEARGIPPKCVIIGHELTRHTRTRLVDGTMDAVITQDVGHLVRSSIRVLKARITQIGTVASQERIRIEIILRENLPKTNGL